MTRSVDETSVPFYKLGSALVPSNLFLFLGIEFMIGVAVSAFLSVLELVRGLLPKPPRDLTGHVVLVAGASSSLGESLVEEFAKGGCSVIRVDNEQRSCERTSSGPESRAMRVEEVETGPRKRRERKTRPAVVSYNCNLADRDSIRDTASKVGSEVGRVDVLVTCVGNQGQDIFDTASTTLMSHYWTVLAFLPLLLHQDRAHVVGVTPVASDEDAYLGSRAAITGLMDSLGRELSDRDSRITFLAVAPTANRRSMIQSERQVARDVVQAVRTDRCGFSDSWHSKILYRTSCAIHAAVTSVAHWFHARQCDYSL